LAETTHGATAEAGATFHQRIGFAFEQVERAFEHRAQFDDMLQCLARRVVAFDAIAGDGLDGLGSASGSAPNWRASPFKVCAGMTSAAAFCARIAFSIAATDFTPSSRK